MGLAQRTMTRVLEVVGERKWGVRPQLMRHIVATLGAAGAARWFVSNLPRYERTLAKLGPIRTHILCVAISVTNGCEYCTYAHGLALELHVFKGGTLFPMDEHELAALHSVAPEARLPALEDAVANAALPDTAGDLARLRRLFDGAAPSDAVNRRIAHLVRMFATLNRCAIDNRVMPDEAHDAINKDKPLLARYRAARGARPR